MKSKFFAIAALVGVAAHTGVFAQSSVSVYGRIDTSIESVRTGQTSVKQMTSNASRLGFRGAEDLGGGYRAVFGLELGVSSDNGTIGTPPFRNSYVGIGGPFGVIDVGRIDSAAPTRTPLYALVTRHTEFVIHDAGATAIGTSVLNARTRVSNAIGYASPVMNNVVVRAGYYLNGEGRPEAAGTPIRYEGDYRQSDLSVSYGEESGPLGLGIGFGRDDKRGGTSLNDFKSKWMLVGSYDFGPVRAWGILDRENFLAGPGRRKTVNVRLVGLSVEAGAQGKVVANYMTRDVQADPKAVLRRFQVGYSYQLSKRTSLYAFLDRSDPNNRVANDVIRALGVGVQHNF